MKLPAGPTKIILADYAAAEENTRRASARGTIFKPVFTVWVDGEKPQRHDVFTFKAKSITPRTTTGNFPFKWANTALKKTRVWFETEAEMDIITTQPETM